MRDSWPSRVERAAELAAREESTRSLLEMYGRLLVLQRDCYDVLEAQAARLSGALERDLVTIDACLPRLLEAVAVIGPPRLADEARQTIDADRSTVAAMLLTAWRTPADEPSLARVVLQPYASCLAAHALRPLDRSLPRGDNVCPFCGGAPVVSILQHAPDRDGGGRYLQCGTCFTTWPFRRIRCPRCGEEDEPKLGYFHAPDYDHLRLDTCETCRYYLKSVDLTRLGLAVPVVDEVAGAALDLWAHERGYEKIELNLVGL